MPVAIPVGEKAMSYGRRVVQAQGHQLVFLGVTVAVGDDIERISLKSGKTLYRFREERYFRLMEAVHTDTTPDQRLGIHSQLTQYHIEDACSPSLQLAITQVKHLVRRYSVTFFDMARYHPKATPHIAQFVIERVVKIKNQDHEAPSLPGSVSGGVRDDSAQKDAASNFPLGTPKKTNKTNRGLR